MLIKSTCTTPIIEWEELTPLIEGGGGGPGATL